jgi:mono/diheme cytochrome c family protein
MRLAKPELAIGCVLAMLVAGARVAGLQTPAAALPTSPPFTPASVKAVVDTYCVTCHNERLQSGGIALGTIDFANAAAHAESLERVVRKLGTGAMPPLGAPRPDTRTTRALVSWIAGELDRAAAARPHPGDTLLRRLNRTEYANAIRDLLDLTVNVSALLPADNATHGFDNVADGLGVSPVLLQSYLTAARRVSATAVGDAAEIPVSAETYRVRASTRSTRSPCVSSRPCSGTSRVSTIRTRSCC